MAEEAVTLAPRFEMRGIRKAFGATLAVDGVDLSVAPGEVCAVVGQNGAGKSTLMAILSGALRPDAGTMALDGIAYQPSNPMDARQAGVAMIYQELSLAPHLSVAENILLGMEPSRWGLLDRAAMHRKAGEVLARLGHPEISTRTSAGSLSPAAQQLVEIARALAVGCRVLVLDEPTSSLATADAHRLFSRIADLKSHGTAVVYISHFIEEVKTVADRIVVLRDGRVAGGAPAASLSPADIVKLMVGRSVDALYPRSPRHQGEAILDVEGFGPSAATFALHRGEIIGIAGLLGAGRTRFLRSLFGLEAVRRGRVRLGVFSGPATPHQRWQQGMGFLSEDRKEEGLAAGLSIADNMTLSRLTGLGPGPFVLPREQARAATRWIERLAIRARSPRQTVAELSGGNQQKVAMARLLHHDVDVFVLDEPTRGIDVGSKAQIYELIDSLVSERQGARPRAVLMVSSYVPELLGLCDRIAVMCRGTLSAPRPAGAWNEHDLMLAATGAGDAA
ncbi:MAG TPA: sugar ABC transporter ATP-binding protein [Vicinamibacterales bacterium]|nr:sugar ABC transporter ATP-binding protein [Vicinamibacterales bacterium]